MRRLLVLALSAVLAAAAPGVSSASSAAREGIARDTKAKCHGFAATKVGTDRSQVIRGTDHRDVILAKGGADRIFTGDGNDIICAGPGNDVIEGGDGKDRIFGSGGNDTLRGGPGHDRLVGGGGLDGCYPAAGNDRMIDCEPADLIVTIVGPTTAHEGQRIDLTFRIANVGSTRSSPFELVITSSPIEAICNPDPSGTTALQSVWPKAFVETDISMSCTIQPGTDPHVVLTAALDMDLDDDDPANDQTVHRIEIEPALPVIQ
jgi:hypothetical protein